MSSKNETKEDTITSTTTTATSPSRSSYSQQQEQEQSVNRALNETRDNIRKTIDEARNQIPRYTQAVNDYQEQTIQATREIADNYLDSQREIINSFQTAWVPQIENANRAFWSNWMSPRQATETYARIVSSFADNTIAATRLVNNAIFANMDAFKTSIQHAKENAKEFSRIGVNAAKTFEQTTRDADRSGNTVSGFSVETEGRQRRY
jgi:phage-related protein